MNVLNITFNSIKAEKTATPKGKVSVTSNVNIENIEENKMGLDKERTALKFKFNYKTEYQPSFATIELGGEATTLMTKDEAKKIQDAWTKTKKSLDKKYAATLLNNIMAKCSIQSILMAKELSLPSPIPLPKIATETPKETPKK
ncbi:hypothetical protein K9L97_05245 [Candidatus Woesearchaeota archaeon]|nr:hypothetical protein [Candidatus Woesearchaeota archaeon]